MATPVKNTPTGKFGFPHILLILGLSILLCGEAYFGYQLHSLSKKQERIKEDYSVANNITFGIFSVDQWRDRIEAVVKRQVTDFKMTDKQKKELQATVTKQLRGLVSETVKEINKPQKSLGGKLKKFAFNQFVDVDKIQAQVPAFAKTIITTVNSPSSQKRLKNIASSKFNQLVKQTYDSTKIANETVTSLIHRKYGVSGTTEFDTKINGQLNSIRNVTYNYAYAMLACVGFAIILWWLMRKKVKLHSTLFIFSIFFAVVLLVVGITASIIEVDARIQTLDFKLLGETITFKNQELFFQSKSILGIIGALLEQKKPDAIVVGALILLFVVVLPILRLIAKGIHVLTTDKYAENKVVKYLTFELGKWDMSDVMVVGIFMTFMGLNGILDSQLSGLNMKTDVLQTVAVNNSSLQPGFIIFVGYVVFEFILSYLLKRLNPGSQIV
ncbi:paraquat-inducible protein A [Pedobacter jamesrossensis]|uniref:Paraquat-inducible protein A n=1 Tax=Pedobacter jamesrossensis TaxID=1908238 RepID=A0ABV8NSL3_9SPHI